MKTIQIVHNPTAGSEDHSKKSLIKSVKAAGYKSEYVSTDDDDWKEFDPLTPDLILLAGGDGTVRKLASVLLKRNDNGTATPVGLLPLGTANNISKTLRAGDNLENQLKNFENKQLKKFDCGRVKGLNDINFFIEAVGFGVFPELISSMQKNKLKGEPAEEKLKRSLEELVGIIQDFKAGKAKIITDDFTIEENFLMVELMNIKSIGPNLNLAPDADAGDGLFDLVMIPEGGREELKIYIQQLIDGKTGLADISKFAEIRQVKNVKLEFPECLIHADDELISDYKGETIEVEMMEGRLTLVAN